MYPNIGKNGILQCLESILPKQTVMVIFGFRDPKYFRFFFLSKILLVKTEFDEMIGV